MDAREMDVTVARRLNASALFLLLLPLNPEGRTGLPSKEEA